MMSYYRLPIIEVNQEVITDGVRRQISAISRRPKLRSMIRRIAGPRYSWHTVEQTAWHWRVGWRGVVMVTLKNWRDENCLAKNKAAGAAGVSSHNHRALIMFGIASNDDRSAARHRVRTSRLTDLCGRHPRPDGPSA
jgi:hypothetical protein